MIPAAARPQRDPPMQQLHGQPRRHLCALAPAQSPVAFASLAPHHAATSSYHPAFLSESGRAHGESEAGAI